VHWSAAQALLRQPVFEPLRPSLDRLAPEAWPTHEALSALAAGIETSRGRALRFVAPGEHTERERRYYELHIADTGEVETRRDNWHDLFNALQWIAFPRAKAMINAQHAAILEERGDAEAKRRSPERDALTLFDEGGVIVASSDPQVFQRIRDFAWKEMFWHRRTELAKTTRFFAFGHSLYEKSLDPYLGMVAKTVFVPLSDARGADEEVARYFSDRGNFTRPKDMAPMPVLGVPGWHPDTEREVFYDDPQHFRGPRPK